MYAFRFPRVIALFLALALLATSACGPSNGGSTPGGASTPGGGSSDTPRQEQGVALLQSNLPRQKSPAAQDEVAAAVSGNTAFALSLYQAERGEAGNLFFSPYSISLALAMTFAGARGQTEAQMAQTLHFTLHQNQLHPALNTLDQSLSKPGETAEVPDFRLHLANSIWGQKDFPFRQAYLDVLAQNYGAGLRGVDFTDDGQREAARQAINQWVAEATQGKIAELFKPGLLTVNSRLVLANAIYFKGEWVDPFLSGTRDAPFTRLDGSQVTVPMMSRRADAPFAQGDGYQAVALPYKGDRIEMVVILPDEGDEGQLEAFEAELSVEKLRAILDSLSSTDLSLSMPKFSYSTELMLADTLVAMGMPDAFDQNQADFSGIADLAQAGGNLYLSHVVHKAFVAVDEQGTEAAAATGVIAEVTSMPQMMHVDRPFIYLIRDRETGTVLFLGRVVDPGTGK